MEQLCGGKSKEADECGRWMELDMDESSVQVEFGKRATRRRDGHEGKWSSPSIGFSKFLTVLLLIST